MNCIEQNGDITGYIVQYGIAGRGTTLTLSVSGGNTTNITIVGLNTATNYSIEVAAMNSVGIGVYSTPVYVITKGTAVTGH